MIFVKSSFATDLIKNIIAQSYMSKFLLVFIILLFNVALVYGQTGTIKGKIIDATTQEEVIGANVVIEGTQIGGSTDINGDFSIFNISPGTYNISITYIGYKPKVVEGVVVYAGKVTLLNTTLEEDAAQLEDIVIEATRETFSEISVISEIRLAETVAVGISAEQISKSLDGNAAEVVRRVPGINVSESNFIRIRGLSERYNAVMLHGAVAPSTQIDIRAFAFDIIPSSQIDRVLVFKSPSAELPADYVGGLVRIYTKSIPSENSITVGYSTSYRVGTSFGDFRRQNKGSNALLGINSGFYDLPEGFPSTPELQSQSDPQVIQQIGRSLNDVNNDWQVQDMTAPTNQSLSLSTAFRFNLGKVKIGNVTAINHGISFTNFKTERNDMDGLLNGQAQPLSEFDDTQYTQSVRTGILQNWSAKFNQNHIIEFKNLFNHSARTEYVDRFSRNENVAAQQFFGSYDQEYKGIYSGQLFGTHSFWNESTKIEWLAGYNHSYYEQPDFRRYRVDLGGTGEEDLLFVPSGNGNPFFFGRFFGKLRENNYIGGLNLTHKLNFLSRKGTELTPELRYGFYTEDRSRDFSARNLGFVRASVNNFDQSLLRLNVIDFLQPENINPTTGVRLDEQTNEEDSYDAFTKIYAGYVSSKFYLHPKLSTTLGVRLENSIQNIKTTAPNTEKEQNLTFLLPSLNITYNLNDKMLIRGAYGMTLNRPEFREIARFSFFDFNLNVVYKGNDTLTIATIQNFDLRYEFYPSPAELISVAVFYKDFKNPIETILAPGGSVTKTFTYANTPRATSLGVEVEVRKSFMNSSSWLLKDLSVVFNGSLIRSRIDIGAELAQSVGLVQIRPMQGQANFIFNTGLFYNNEDKGFQVSLLHNIVGRYIGVVGFTNQGITSYPDIYQMPRHVLDLSVSKNLGKRFNLKAGISDIINQPFLMLQDENLNGNFERNDDWTFNNFRPGQVFSLGLTYRIL